MNPSDSSNGQTPKDDQNQAQGMNQDGTMPQNDMPLSQPNDVPVQTGTPGAGDDTQPANDSNVDSDESYQEGQSAAAGTDQPNQGGSVTDFNPQDDQQPAPPPTAPGGTTETPPDAPTEDPAKGPDDGENVGGSYGSSSFNN